MQVADATALFVNCFGFMSQLPLCSMAGRAVEVARVSLVGGGSYPLTLCSWSLLQCVSVSKGSTFSARSLSVICIVLNVRIVIIINKVLLLLLPLLLCSNNHCRMDDGVVVPRPSPSTISFCGRFRRSMKTLCTLLLHFELYYYLLCTVPTEESFIVLSPLTVTTEVYWALYI